MKCEVCRRATVMDTRWDRIRLWFFKRCFRNDYEDLRADSYTQGIGEGYKLGYQQHKDNVTNAEKLFAKASVPNGRLFAGLQNNEEWFNPFREGTNKHKRTKVTPRRNKVLPKNKTLRNPNKHVKPASRRSNVF